MKLAPLLVALLCLAAVSLVAAAAGADVTSRRAAHEQELEAELAAIAPEATASFAEANRLSEGDPARAIALYEKVSALAPSFTPATRRRAMLLAMTGRREEGVALARRAVAERPLPDNKMALAMILAHHAEGREPVASEQYEALSIARETSTAAPNDVDTQLELCEVLAATQRANDLKTCAAYAIRLAPDEPHPHVFAAIASAMLGDRDAAYESLATARRLGLEPETADRLTAAVDASEPPLYRWGKRLLAVVALWLAGLFGLFGSGVVLSKMTLRTVKRISPSGERPLPGGALLRAVYRAVLHVASFYYYLSLPFVLVIAVALGVGSILGFLYIGRIPIYVVAIIGTLVVVTIVSVVKSLLVRSRDDDPGIPVDLGKHVRLREVIREVADRVGTRAVDEVYLTPSTGIAVLERGSMLRQLRGNTERCLVLGVGVLDGMKLGAFKAVLAHEYGHFSNRDTAGGGLALSVRRSLVHTAMNLAEGGGAVWYSPMWQFLVAFHKIFLRISQGASRLQEVMADRIAAFAYGPEAFVAGLDHVVRRSIEFDAHVDFTLEEVLEHKRALANVYTYVPEKKAEPEKLDEAIKKALEDEPSPYDSHPRPADRFEWARRLPTDGAAPAEDDDHEAWTLFADRKAVEERMTAELRETLEERGIVIPAGPEEGSSAAPAA